MSDKTYKRNTAYDMPMRPCPYCEELMDADWVDVGVGMLQCGPYHCFACKASEIGPELENIRHTLDEDELRTGFYKSRISPLANQRHGMPIDYKTADALYRAEYFAKHGNPYNAPIRRYR